MPQQQLDRSQIAGFSIDLGRLRPAHRVGAVGRAVEPCALNPGLHDPCVLTGREVRLHSKAAREKIAPAPEIDFGQPIADRGPRLLRDLELDWSPGLLLDHGPAVSHPPTGAHVLDLYRDEIAAAQLAIDREVEQGEVALSTLKLKPNPDCPDLLRLERALLPDQATLVPRCLRKPHIGRDRSVHDRLLDPTTPLPARADKGERANVPEGRLFADF